MTRRQQPHNMKKAATLAAVLLVGCALPLAQAQLFLAEQPQDNVAVSMPGANIVVIAILLGLFLGLQFYRGRRNRLSR